MYSKYIREMIINKRKAGYSYGKISSELSLSRSAIQNISNYNLKAQKKDRSQI